METLASCDSMRAWGEIMKAVLPLVDQTVGGMLRSAALQYPSKNAVEYLDRSWTYGELDAKVDEVARQLIACGIKKGDHVGVWSELEPNLLFLYYALARIGAIACLLNTCVTPDDLIELIRRSDISYLFLGRGCKELVFPQIVKDNANRLAHLERIVYISERGDSLGIEHMDDLPQASMDEVLEAEALVQPHDTAQILYTSGTTNFPKAVMGSHFARVNGGRTQARDLGASEDDQICALLPLFHCFSLSVNVTAACAVGACLVIPKSRHSIDVLTAIDSKRCSIVCGTPAHFRAMMHNPHFSDFDISSVRIGIIGGCAYSIDLFLSIEKTFGMKLLSSLGQTEATAGYTISYIDDSEIVRVETLGHFMDHVEGKIVSLNSGENLGMDAEGEICVRGYLVMQGYYGQPVETAEAIDADGWLHTGDLGIIDGDGNLHLTGRVKDLIIRGGENIGPAEIETLANEHHGIDASRAVGVPDEHYGEAICLCIIPSGEAVDEEELAQYLGERLPKFKVPAYYLQMSEFPTTTTGKVQTGKLKEIAARDLGLRA